jgi:DNA-binding CsgD family transcriptional regulator
VAVPGGAMVRTSAPSLIGRTNELRALLTTVARTPSVAMVEGEAGVGKTRLVTELVNGLLAQTDPPGPRVLIGHCQPIGEPFPYGALFDAVRTAADAIGGEPLSPVVGTLRPHLPEIAALLPEPPGRLGDPRAERHRLFRGVRELLRTLGPALLVVEDLHWSDDGSRRLLRFLMSEPPENLALVVTYRREDVPDGLPLGAAYRPSPGTASALIELDPLDPDEVRELSTEILGGRSVSKRFAEVVHERTAGIPFVIEELLHTFESEHTGHTGHHTGHHAGHQTGHQTGHPEDAGRLDGPAARRYLDNGQVPPLLREAMAERIARLPVAATRLTHAAAVVAAPAGSDLLARVAGVPDDRARLALCAALAGNALVEAGDGLYGFRHELARRAAYQSIPAPERQRLHLRAIAALRDVEPSPLVQLAGHCRKAGLVAEWIRYAEAAADKAIEAGDVATATEQLCALLDEPTLPTRSVDRLAAKLARVGIEGIDVHAVTGTLERLLGDRRLSRQLQVEVRLALGLQLVRLAGARETARTQLELAINDLAHRPELAARAMAVLANPIAGTIPLAEHVRWMTQVDELINSSTDQRTIMMLLPNSIAYHLLIGDPAGWRLLDKAQPAADRPEEQRQLARLHCNAADACAWTGHLREAQRLLRSGIQLAEEFSFPYVVSIARSTQTHVDLLTGNWKGLAQRCLSLLEEYREILPVANELALVLGSLAVASGNWETAESQFAETGIDHPEGAFAPVIIAAQAGLTRMWLSRGDHEAAAREADRGLDLLLRKGIWSYAAELAPQLVEAYQQVGRDVDAQDFVDRFQSGIVGRDAPIAHAALALCIGLIATREGDIEAAVASLKDARKRYRALPAPYHATLVTERIAMCRLPSDEPLAIKELSSVAQWFQSMGATIDAARCQHALREKGVVVASRRGRRGYGAELSPREREVARMMADGQTNKAIAEALFLSRRTVERHVANVLKKLRATSRRSLQDDSHRAYLDGLADHAGG